MPKNSIEFLSKDKDRQFVDNITSKLGRLSSNLEPNPRESRFRRYQEVELSHKPEHVSAIPTPAYQYYTQSTPVAPYPHYTLPLGSSNSYDTGHYSDHVGLDNLHFDYIDRREYTPKDFGRFSDYGSYGMREYSSGPALAQALTPPTICVPPSARHLTRVVRESREIDDDRKPRSSDTYRDMLSQIERVDSRRNLEEQDHDVVRAELAAYRRLADWYCQRGGRYHASRDDAPMDIRYVRGRKDLDALESLVEKTFGRKWWQEPDLGRKSPTVADSIMQYVSQQN